MNRIREYKGVYQVLITPLIKMSPDSSLMMGNWDDEYLRNYYILEFNSLNDAQTEAFKHPDLDWYRIVMNHEHIFYRLRNTINNILDEYSFDVELKSQLMTGDMLKDVMFNRVMFNTDRFSMKSFMTDVISFTITNPWTKNVHKVAQLLEARSASDNLRIKTKRVFDGKIVCLYGLTELGSIYQIRVAPTLLKNQNVSEDVYHKLLLAQNKIDSFDNPVVR